jgi:hypothetical protein
LQAFGAAKDHQNWYRSQVIGLRKDINGQFEALVCFGKGKKDASPHEEWIRKDEWRIERILNRFALPPSRTHYQCLE